MGWGEPKGPSPLMSAEREFLIASVAVWREIDRLSGDEYRGIEITKEGVALRRREREAWERYRELLDRGLIEPRPHGFLGA